MYNISVLCTLILFLFIKIHIKNVEYWHRICQHQIGWQQIWLAPNWLALNWWHQIGGTELTGSPQDHHFGWCLCGHDYKDFHWVWAKPSVILAAGHLVLGEILFIWEENKLICTQMLQPVQQNLGLCKPVVLCFLRYELVSLQDIWLVTNVLLYTMLHNSLINLNLPSDGPHWMAGVIINNPLDNSNEVWPFLVAAPSVRLLTRHPLELHLLLLHHHISSSHCRQCAKPAG